MSLRKLLIIILFFVSGCADLASNNAVIEDGAGHIVAKTTVANKASNPKQVKHAKQVSKKRYYTVHKGDTVYSIAFSFGLDFKYLAKANHLAADFSINPGQRLTIPSELNLPQPNQAKTNRHSAVSKVSSVHHQRSIKVVRQAADKTTVASSNLKKHRSVWRKSVEESTRKRQKLKKDFNFAQKSVKCWFWPVKGKVVSYFSTGRVGNKGLDITGKYAQPIKAVADGKVVYSGSGLRGYGNLIIIKHNDQYLSAYAYNKELLVAEGKQVKARQVIAKMGHSTNGRTMLHFEIRRNGKPINPLRYLR